MAWRRRGRYPGKPARTAAPQNWRKERQPQALPLPHTVEGGGAEAAPVSAVPCPPSQFSKSLHGGMENPGNPGPGAGYPGIWLSWEWYGRSWARPGQRTEMGDRRDGSKNPGEPSLTPEPNLPTPTVTKGSSAVKWHEPVSGDNNGGMLAGDTM